MKFFSIICAWFGVAFAAEAMGLFAHELNAAAAVILLLMSGILAIPRPVPVVATGSASGVPTAKSVSEPSVSFPLIGLIMCIVGILMVPSHWTIRLFGIALWFWGLETINRRRTGHTSYFAVLAIATLVFGTLQYLYGNSLTSWYIGQDISNVFARLGHWFYSFFETKDKTNTNTFGPTFSGIGLIGFAMLVFLVGGVARGRGLFWTLGAMVAAAMVFEIYLCIFAGKQLDSATLLREDLEWSQRIWKAIHPLYMTSFLAMGLCIPVALFLRGVSRPVVEANDSKTGSVAKLGWVAIPMAVLGVILFVNAPGERREGKGVGGKPTYALYKEGFHNWMTPNKQRYGSRSAGMFGNLPVMLDAMGWEGDTVETLDDAALANRDLLFLANPKDHLDAETIARIDRFVEDGGSLLMLGDHTWRKDDEPGGDKILDEAIQTTNIRYNFDSAYYYIGGWLHSLQYWPHQSTVHLRDETNESGCVVGASLDISYPATPLIVGRYGYADKGVHVRNPQRGYMDNGMPDPDERIGDMVLVAAQNVGKGRVVVVGDTSGFVNAIQTQTWRFTARVFDWLASTGQATVARWRDVLGVLLLVGAVGLVVWFARNQQGVVPATCAVMLLAGWGARSYLDSNAKAPPLTKKIAMVDLSHVGLHSMEAWRDNAISGIYLNLMREGYFSLGARDFDEEQLLNSEVFVTVAPSKPYSASELDALDRFMNKGGTVVLSVGWEEKAGSESLLKKYGLDIQYKPQGRATNPIPGTNIMPNYWEVWPVISDENFGPPAETLATLREDPTIVRRRVGAGQLVVIGDTKIFYCQNFETEEGAVMPNVQFFGWLVNNILKQGAI